MTVSYFECCVLNSFNKKVILEKWINGTFLESESSFISKENRQNGTGYIQIVAMLSLCNLTHSGR